jgi:predicted flap endonuclease-1-like 5' DNA nuclease
VILPVNQYNIVTSSWEKENFFMLSLQAFLLLPAVSPLLQTSDRGTTPIWVIIVLLLLVIALFWWGLNRPSYDQAPAPDTATDQHHETGDDHALVQVETAVPVAPDDLKRIEGIGPKIETILHHAGILTFAQLAAAEVTYLEKVVREDAGIRIAFPATWPEQARLAAAGDWEALAKLQDELQAGREAV